MCTSQINSIFFYYQIELDFKLFRQFPKFNLPESRIYQYAKHLIESLPPIKHQKINLVQGSVVEPLIKSSVTNFNHYMPSMGLGTNHATMANHPANPIISSTTDPRSIYFHLIPNIN